MTTLQAHQQYLTTILERQKRRRKDIDPKHDFPPQVQLHTANSAPESSSSTVKLGTDGSADKSHVVNYVQAEETIRNDYTAWYTASGIPGSDYILGAQDHEICEEYVLLSRLLG
jgi:hypothetical protein